MHEFISKSEEETKAIAREFSASLKGQEVVLIYGPLASGKTVFVKGMASGLGIDEDLVSSPTFTIMNIYTGEKLLFHLDLYRAEEKELDLLGIEDFLGMGVLAVEWGEKAESQPWAEGSIRIRILPQGEERKIIIEK